MTQAVSPKWLQKLDRVQTPIFVLYVISLVTSMSGMELFSTLLAICIVLRFFFDRSEKRPRGIPPLVLPIFVFITVVLIGVILGEATPSQKWYDVRRMRFFIVYFVLYYQMTFCLKSISSKSVWYRAMMYACIVVGIYGFFQHFIPMDLVRPVGKKIILYAIPFPPTGPLVLGTFNHHLTFANIFLPIASLFLATGIRRGNTNWLSIGVGALLMLCCVWTQSRAAWFAVSLVFILLGIARGGWKFGGTALLVVILCYSTLFATDEGFRERFSRTFLQRDDYYQLGPRKRQWRVQWEIFKDHPVFGIGYNNNERQAKFYMDRYYPDTQNNPYGHGHSTILQLLACTGLTGLGAYLWIWWGIFRNAGHLIKLTSPFEERWWMLFGLWLGFVAFHIQGISQWNFGDAEVLHNLMFLWALLGSLGRRISNESEVPVLAA